MVWCFINCYCSILWRCNALKIDGPGALVMIVHCMWWLRGPLQWTIIKISFCKVEKLVTLHIVNFCKVEIVVQWILVEVNVINYFMLRNWSSKICQNSFSNWLTQILWSNWSNWNCFYGFFLPFQICWPRGSNPASDMLYNLNIMVSITFYQKHKTNRI